jgi:hypothetical protein
MFFPANIMKKISLFKEKAVNELFEKVSENLESYRSGGFDHLLDANLFLDYSIDLSEEIAKSVSCSEDDHNEVGCCMALHTSLIGVTPYLARDERLWARLSHIEFLNYARSRWPIPNDDHKAVDHIKTHFFARGSRGVERDNAISRLWWMAQICSKVKNLTLEQSLTAFLHQSDVRANIIERPSTSQNPTVISAVVNKLHQSYIGDKRLHERETFRQLMKKMNLEGGMRLFEALDEDTVISFIDEIAEKL